MLKFKARFKRQIKFDFGTALVRRLKPIRATAV